MTKRDNNAHKTIEQWVDEYTSYLLRWAHYKTSSPEVAEDLVQDTFLSAIQSFSKFNNNSTPRTWLMSILNHKIMDYFRRTGTKMARLKEESAVEAADALFSADERWVAGTGNTDWEEDANLLDNKEFNKLLKHCLEELPGKWRQITEDKYLLEKKSEEICQEYGITTTNYWQILHRSKLLLKKCIEKGWLS